MQCNICGKDGVPGTLFPCSSCGYIVCADPVCSTKEGDGYVCSRCLPTGKVAKNVYKDKDGKSKTMQEITGGAEGNNQAVAKAPVIADAKPVDDLASLAELCADPEKLDAAIKKKEGELEGTKRILALLRAAKSGSKK